MDKKPVTKPTTGAPSAKTEAVDNQKKMPKTSIDATVLFRPLRIAFRKFHVTIFIIVIGGALVYAVVNLSNLVSQAAGGLSNNGGPTTGFDQTTITELRKHHTSSTTSPSDLGSGRINPFAEASTSQTPPNNSGTPNTSDTSDQNTDSSADPSAQLPPQ